MITIPPRFVIFGQKWAKIEKIDLKIFCWPERKMECSIDHAFIRVTWPEHEIRLQRNHIKQQYFKLSKFGSSIHRPLGSNSLIALVCSGRRNRFFSDPGLDRSENSMLVLARFLLIQSGSIRGFLVLVWMQHFLVTRLYRKNRNWNRFQV